MMSIHSKAAAALIAAISLSFSSTDVTAFVALTKPSSSQHRVASFAINDVAPSLAAKQQQHGSIVSLRMADDDDEMDVEYAMEDAKERMEKSVESVMQNMNSVRTGRASAAMLDLVKADYYGAKTPINQMATISVPSAQQLTVDPYDKSVLGDIERAIMDANLGLTPQNDGSIIRLNIPALTEERRKEMMKSCKSIGEDGKVSVRNIRRKVVDAIKKMEKSGSISEDESKSSQDDVQKMTDSKVKEIESIVERKEKEVMTV